LISLIKILPIGNKVKIYTKNNINKKPYCHPHHSSFAVLLITSPPIAVPRLPKPLMIPVIADVAYLLLLTTYF